MRAKIFNALKISALAVVLSVGVAYVYAQVAPGPQCAPPNCNAAAPLNVSGTMQEKKITDAAGAPITSVKLLNKGYGVYTDTVDSTAAGVYGHGGLFGVVGGTSQAAGTGVSGAGDFGVAGFGTVADFFAKNTGVRFPDGSQQKTAVTWKVCEGSNATYFNEAFIVPPSWSQFDCANELMNHIVPLAWWRVGCFDASTPNTGSSWGAMGGGLPANNSCGWGVLPPPDPSPRGSLFCWKYPNDPRC